MPIRSKAQWGFMFAKHEQMAKRWQKEAPVAYRSLPEHTKKKKKIKK